MILPACNMTISQFACSNYRKVYVARHLHQLKPVVGLTAYKDGMQKQNLISAQDPDYILLLQQFRGQYAT